MTAKSNYKHLYTIFITNTIPYFDLVSGGMTKTNAYLTGFPYFDLVSGGKIVMTETNYD